MRTRVNNRLAPVAMVLLLTGAQTFAEGVPIKNDTVWRDDRGEEIMCQGGNLAKFGDTFCFYGWGDYPGDNRHDTINCYSSRDLASWKFENHIYTRDATNLTLIVPDRLHVIYNAATKKYVMIGKHILPVDDPPIPGQPRVTGGVSFFTSDTPVGAFTYLGHEMLPAGASPGTDYHRDLAAFQDTDGQAYVVSAHDQHKPHRNIMITRLTPDYLKVDRAICEIPLTGVAREAPYIIRLKGRYWLFVSGHGVGGSPWNGSPTSYATAEKLQGPWTAFKTVKCEPESKDCFNAQNDFLFEVRGSAGSFVLWGGDRWSQRTKLGIGKNVWLPLQWQGDEPVLKWHPAWNVDAAAGTWTAAPKATGTLPTVLPAAPDATSTAPLIPRIAGDWRTVAGNPDLDDLNDPKQQPVDFSIWQAADGTWQLWSCIRYARIPGATVSSRLFFRWEGPRLTDPDWKPMGIALQADPRCGEDVGSIWSPFVLKIGTEYNLFYGAWVSGTGFSVSKICRATSTDGKTFVRELGADGQSGLFAEDNTNYIRDPMVIQIGTTYHLYYCCSPQRSNGRIDVRTSKDLSRWSEARTVAFGGKAGTGFASAECPFVWYHAASGYYYLFRTQAYGNPGRTIVYASKDPMDFGIDDDRFLVGTLPVAAASSSRYHWRDQDTDYSVGTPEGGFKDWIKFRQRQGFNNITAISSFPSWSFEDGQPQDLYDHDGVCLRLAWEHAGLNRPETMLNEEGERPFLFPGKSKGFENVSPDFDRLNPSYFRYLDKKIDYANAQGFVIFLETLRRDILGAFKGYHHLTSTDPAKNAMFHYIRYIYNRYQAHNVIFSPIHLDVYNAPLGAKDLRVPIDLHHAKYGRPPFGQPVTTCINRSTYERFGHTDKAPWLTMHTVGNTPRDHTASDLIEQMWNLPSPIPIFNQEPWFVADDSAKEAWENRRTMYSCLLRGGLGGVVYEAMGQTRAVRETSDLPPGTHGKHPLMWVSVLWTNANETQHARTFMLTHGAKYQDLVPHKELLSPAWNSTPYWSYCMRTDDKRLFKLYIEKNDARTDLSGALPNTAYKAQWFNPRTGAWADVGDGGVIRSNGDGVVSLPACPSTEDWCLSLSTE